ncbi:putative leucine-rich repeat receptor-like protein kinase At2g19210 [Solanum tuberosum]|uniref:putative leucine-rich repeat receptor-like protein kinase At2g19210 n=1 Tax=Solanum tuberosum TaxID=4113 RepID=UPI00073A191E|nr:PREDICTED: putative leucine-rich repeat receptor-like protein kinase At2g19210 [Solanum tuberosum]
MMKDLIFIFLILFALEANAQIDESGFVSIDCGIPQGTDYTDIATGLQYVSDSGFIDTGSNAFISSEFQADGLEQQLYTLTSFPEGKRNCYTIRIPQGKGKKYLIRARFLYGNYDGKNQLLINFDLHLGVDFWDTIHIVNASTSIYREIIHILSSDFVHVCLVNTGRGTPFISALELRLLNSTMYVTESGSLQTVTRLDLGSTSTQFARYKDDMYDRLWLPYNEVANTVQLSTSLTIDGGPVNNNFFRPPPKVLSTAIAADNDTSGISYSWEPANSTDENYIYLHFAEIEANHVNRQFDIYLDGELFQTAYAPSYLSSNTIYSGVPITPRNTHQITLNKTGNSIRQPTINAIEIYKVVKQIITTQTNDLDVEAIMNVKSTYEVKKNWQGDPCGPKADIWNGVTCNFDGQLPTIISLNLSSSELQGTLSPFITSLTNLETLNLSNNQLTGEVPANLSRLAFLQELDLSNNQLTGKVPANLAQLPFLKKLYLKGNSFSEKIPEELLAKSKNESLDLRYDEFRPPKGSNNLSPGALAAIVASVVVLGILALLLLLWFIIRRKKNKKGKITGTERTVQSPNIALELKNRQFTYSQVLHMTNNFQRVLGKGGFGTVYLGSVDNRDVAVKMLSPSSVQGFKEFRAEASLLMSIHHKNLISIVGYCVEGTHIGIIYEYMANRSLDMQLSDRNPNALTWEERLHIALDAAQGLEYLHHGCQPPIIHRDIKSSNILLDDKFQAKLADFGLSRTLPTGEGSHVTTIIAGSPGYLDPDYYRTNKLTEKSDVYSFGVVLLEIITGRHLLGKHDKIYVITWVNGMINDNGDVSKIIDPRLGGEVDVNSAKRIVALAMACVSLEPTNRPAISVVVTIIKQCLRQMIDNYDSN